MPRLDDDTLLRCSFSCHGGQAVVRLDGDLDLASVADAYLALELAAATHTQVTVDCGGLQFVDVAGLRFLIRARDQAQASGGDLMAGHPLPVVRRSLEIIGRPSLISVREPDDLGGSCCHVRGPAAAHQAALTAALRISGASKGNIQLLDPAAGQLRIVAQRGFARPFLDFFAAVEDTGSACGTALSRGTPVWVNDVARSPIFADTEAGQAMLDAGAQAVASLPICPPSGEVIAMVSVHYDRPVGWPRWSRLHLEYLAGLTGRLLSQCLPADPPGRVSSPPAVAS